MGINFETKFKKIMLKKNNFDYEKYVENSIEWSVKNWCKLFSCYTSLLYSDHIEYLSLT